MQININKPQGREYSDIFIYSYVVLFLLLFFSLKFPFYNGFQGNEYYIN